MGNVGNIILENSSHIKAKFDIALVEPLRFLFSGWRYWECLKSEISNGKLNFKYDAAAT